MVMEVVVTAHAGRERRPEILAARSWQRPPDMPRGRELQEELHLLDHHPLSRTLRATLKITLHLREQEILHIVRCFQHLPTTVLLRTPMGKERTQRKQGAQLKLLQIGSRLIWMKVNMKVMRFLRQFWHMRVKKM